MDLTANQHDRFFRALMERPKAAGALLRERLPRAIAGQLVGEPELVDGSFIDDEMRQSQCDRLYRVRLREGGEAFRRARAKGNAGHFWARRWAIPSEPSRLQPAS
jgi:hypothetical protein